MLKTDGLIDARDLRATVPSAPDPGADARRLSPYAIDARW